MGRIRLSGIELLALLSLAGLAGCGPDTEGPATADDSDRGIGVADSQLEQGAGVFGDYHALIIGVDGYHNWPQLKYAEGDAADVYQLLNANYGFRAENTVQLYGETATRSGILAALRQKLQSLTENDNLFVYYAGHGQLDPLTESGYWVPVEGHLYDSSSWIPFSTITELLRSTNIQAKNVAVITDSCYGGAITRAGPTPGHTAPEQGLERYLDTLRSMADHRSRQVIASGGYEQVPDQSLFSDLLKDAFRDNAYPLIDLEYLFFTRVYPDLREVGLQEPMMARLVSGPNSSGQFVLVRSSGAAEPGAGEVVTEEERAEPAVSTLTVRSNVVGDMVYIGGQAKGPTRLDIDLLPGDYDLKVDKAGYEPYESLISLSAGEHRTVNAQLRKVVTDPPRVLEFDASIRTARPGEAITLRWRTENADAVEIGGLGAVPSSGTRIVTPAEDTSYRLTATGAGQTTQATLDIKINARAPRIVDLVLKPDQARRGEEVTLGWRTEDAGRVEIMGRQQEPSGSITFNARESMRIELVATSVDGRESASAWVTLNVLGPPGIVSFDAASTTITQGEKTRLRWQTRNADLVELKGFGVVGSQGSQEVAPTETTTYDLRAAAGTLADEKSVTVEVKAPWTAPDPGRRFDVGTIDPGLIGRVAMLPAVASSGDLAIRQTYTADLDTGKTSAGAASDVWFQAATATDRYLVPRNGAVIGPVRSEAVGYSDCSGTRMTSSRVNVKLLSAGKYICLKTNMGRFSRLQVVSPAGPSPGTLTLKYTTWQ